MVSKDSFSLFTIGISIIGIVIGGFGGYYYTKSIYDPIIQGYETDVAEKDSMIQSLNNDIDELEIDIEEKQTLVTNYINENNLLNQEINNYESQVLDLKLKNTQYKNEINYLESQINTFQIQISNLESEINTESSQNQELQDDLDKILSIDVKQHYEWVYNDWLWSNRYQWDLTIPLSLYFTYYDLPRPSSWRDWVNMVKDSGDDAYIRSMVQQINSAAIIKGFTEIEKVNFVIAFVQSLPYTVDSVTTSWNEYPRYPIETLFDRGGDCEDTSILVCALLDQMGYDTALLLLEDEEHCAVGVSITGASGVYYEVDGKKYYYLETTGDGFKIGQIPSSITQTRAYIYEIN